MTASARTDNAFDFAALYRTWRTPMYNFYFSLIPVTLEELAAAQRTRGKISRE
jgi:hypothetical protein